MKRVLILGSSGAQCEKLKENVELAARESGLQCRIEKVTDAQRIAAYGVTMTPALVVDGRLRYSGRVPRVEDVKRYLA